MLESRGTAAPATNKASSATPPTQCSSGVLGLKIVFPDCVAKGDLNDPNLVTLPSKTVPNPTYRAGEKLDPDTGQVIDPDTGQVIDSAEVIDPDTGQVIHSPDHESHMVKSKLLSNGTRACPSTYPIPVPTLTVNINFPMPTTLGTVVLSSGNRFYHTRGLLEHLASGRGVVPVEPEPARWAQLRGPKRLGEALHKRGATRSAAAYGVASPDGHRLG